MASVLYALGYATERQLCNALAAQNGWPAAVLDETAIRLDVLEHISLEWARLSNALIIAEDADSITIAAARPEDAIIPARQLGAQLGKRVELRIALDVTLARTIRMAFRKWKRGELFQVGAELDPRRVDGPILAVVFPDGGDGAEEHRRAQRALAEDAARSIELEDELPSEEISPSVTTLTGEWQNPTTTTNHEVLFEMGTEVIVAELDRLDGVAPEEARGVTRALIVDPDPPGRIQLVGELERLGYECQAASSGDQAVDLLASIAFDLVFADVSAPELDGLRLCRAIKGSRRLARTKVVITASVVDTGQIPDDVLTSHGADGYVEKPLDSRRLHRLLRDLAGEERSDPEPMLAEALGRYHAGDLDGAISQLRGALVTDPASPKLHFMLANLLQRASRWAEAIDEYELVVELQPNYFPALTRLAYLYFRQGLHARAVETWRRALPVCEDPALRQNIELFMRKLIADMARPEGGG